MKYLTLAILVLSLSGCMNAQYRPANYPVIPDELKDCKMFELFNDNGGYIVVVRCPNSTTSTTYTSGKSKRTTIVVDGVTYEAKETEK